MQVSVSAHAPSDVKVDFDGDQQSIGHVENFVEGEARKVTITARRVIATITFADGNCSIEGNYSKTFPVDQPMRCHFVDPASQTQWLVTTKIDDDLFFIFARCLPQHPPVNMLRDLPDPTINTEFVAIFGHVQSCDANARLFVVFSRITGEMGCFPGKNDRITPMKFEGQAVDPFILGRKTGHLQLAEMMHMPPGSYFGFTAFADRGLLPANDDCLRSEANPCKDHMSRSAPREVALHVAEAFNKAVGFA